MRFQAMKVPLLIGLLLLIVAGTAPELYAQPFGNGDEDTPPAWRRLRELRRIKLIEFLDLSEEQSARLFAREKEFFQGQKKFHSKYKEKTEDLKKLVEDDASDVALRQGIRDTYNVFYEMGKDKSDFTYGLEDILSTEQLAKYVIFEAEWADEVKEFLGKFRDKKKDRQGKK